MASGRLERMAVGALVGACLLRALWPLPRFARERMREGFSADAALALAALHERHPAWTFEPIVVTDMTWCAVLTRECSPGWNLVESNAFLCTPYFAPNARAYDSGVWYQASREAVAYFMDPRNFLGEREIFMFETLGYNPQTQTREAVERALENSFLHKAPYDGGKRTFAELLLEVGAKEGISPVFLAARLRGEQGGGTVQAKGRIGDSLLALAADRREAIGGRSIWGGAFARTGTNTLAVIAKGKNAYNGYYNLFNIGACGTGLFEIRYNAWREAAGKGANPNHGEPWTSQEKAIRGGAAKIRERYIASFRHTRYLQKFSVAPQAGPFRWKQYMQNISAPLTEARATAAAYSATGQTDAPHRFVIPVYREAPCRPSPDPGR